jgi:RNA polymerase sigma factor (sigma-70 family)
MAYVVLFGSAGAWHGVCITESVNIFQISPRASITTQSFSKGPRIPRNPSIRKKLTARGVTLALRTDENHETFEARIETCLMALFRDDRGEEEFNALYDYSSAGLQVQVSRQLAGSRGRLDPKEVCQDVFVNVYRYSSGFRDEQPRSFRVWSGTIARNAIRRRYTQPTGLSFQDMPDGVSEPADPRRTPLAQILVEEERSQISGAWGVLLLQYLAAFEQLSSRDQDALHMIEVEGLTYSEGCDRLGVGMSNMKMIMFRARRRLRMHMAASMANAISSERQVG